MVPLPCPLCDFSGTSLRKEIAVTELLKAWEKAFQIDISGDFQDVQQLHLFECERCGLQFYLWPSLGASSELYSQLQKFEWYYTAQKWEHDIALEDLTDCEHILEIGSGSGVFIARAQAEKGLNIQGIETNSEAVNSAQRLGLPVESIDLTETALRWLGYSDEDFEFHVLEHVSKQKNVLDSCFEFLTRAVILLVGLPNAKSCLRYLF